ncbi:MAG TPA: uroporphyrinogen decarboxylase family protein, partial [bacterium]|nr:uroporphyrinogen decarboxylase family protein [bacterium]
RRNIMTERERYVKTLLFEKVDKVFFSPGGPRESTLKRWHSEGLPEDVNWFEYLCEQIGIVMEKGTGEKVYPEISFDMIPPFEEKILEHKDGHYIVQDIKGAIVEIDDNFDLSYLRSAKDFVTRKWHKFPVGNLSDWEDMKKRYNPLDPARISSSIKEIGEKIKDRDYIISIGIAGPFWQLRDWCGFENLCILMAQDPGFVMEMTNFWKDFVLTVLDRVKGYVVFDSVVINEDMAYKEKSMISPAMARKFLIPVWSAWSSKLREMGCKVIILDSDGYIGELIPLWIESGINCCVPIEVAAGNDIVEYRKIYGSNMAYIGGIDKRAIAKGGEIMRKEVYRVVPPLLKDGGYIPGCDHGVPNDISWQNFIEYSKLLAELLGWK